MPEARVRARTPWIVRYVFNPIFLRTGVVPILTVRGRKTGRVFRTPVNVPEVNGMKYLVSPRGETNWSRNLRATPEVTLTVKGREQRFRAAEVPPEERAPIIAAYLAQGGGQVRGQFEKLPDPADHPTFRLDPL
jgi:deazaflavin-dependent oxidoreductase (nitroreductase family)